MKRFFITFKISVVFLSIFAVGLAFLSISVPTLVPKPTWKHSVTIDAGHGGRDGGAVGISTGVIEKNLNLKYANTLKKILESNNISVTMTRSGNDGLYSEFDKNKKLSDMNKRLDIINKANSTLFVSIHMNSFPDNLANGSQIFYQENSKSENMQFANLTQKAFNQIVPNAKKTSKSGDYFLLKNSNPTAILIECGFLSNKEEEQLLQEKFYIEKICYAIFCGIFAYLNS